MVGGFGGNIALALAGPWLADLYGWRVALMALAVPGWSARSRSVRWRQTRRAGRRRRRLRGPTSFTVVIAFIVWQPSLLVADHGFSVQSAGLIVAAGAALTAASNLVGGYVSDRLRNPPLVIGGTFAVLACASWLLATVESVPLLFVAIALGAIFLQFYFGPIFLVPVEVLGPRLAGTATGVGNLFANIGGFLTTYAFGAIKDHTGSFAWGYRSVSLLCISGVAVVRARADTAE